MNKLKEKYIKEVVPGMKKFLGVKNDMAVPKLIKVVISSGTGSKSDENKKKLVEKSLELIGGQKPYGNPAKKSISSFKLREGMIIGYSVTLRGDRMYDFLEKLINVAIPRIRDFRGIDTSVIDEVGNLSIGIKEHIVFPETSDQDVREAFGLGITVVSGAKTKKEALEFFKLLGFPFKK